MAEFEYDHVLPLDEGERQMVMLALAHLAVARPGWKHALSEIAARVDNTVNGTPEMFENMYELRRSYCSDVATQLAAMREAAAVAGGRVRLEGAETLARVCHLLVSSG